MTHLILFMYIHGAWHFTNDSLPLRRPAPVAVERGLAPNPLHVNIILPVVVELSVCISDAMKIRDLVFRIENGKDSSVGRRFSRVADSRNHFLILGLDPFHRLIAQDVLEPLVRVFRHCKFLDCCHLISRPMEFCF